MSWRAPFLRAALPGALAGLVAWPAHAQSTPGQVYRCPGPPVLYTDQLSPQEARDRGCRTIEGAPITIVQGNRPRTAAPAAAPGTAGAAPAAGGPAAPAAGARGAEARVDPAEQRARDSDARRILGEELRREEERLAAMVKEFNNGEPERRGEERNYAKYLERVAEMRAAIQRKEADIAAIRRELAKLPN
ncbi:MAG: hypothetical protein ACK5UM_20030 [Pseudomonadota bacterium]|jgi:hypothetical protein|nr:hypothetical protein [Rubrivivax sp.]